MNDAELAGILNVSRSTISEWRSGVRRPSFESILMIVIAIEKGKIIIEDVDDLLDHLLHRIIRLRNL